MYLVLHTLPLILSRHMADVFLSTLLPPPLHPPVIHHSIISSITLQPLPTQHTRSTVYQNDPDTKFLFEHLCHHAPFSKLNIKKLAVTYRKAVAHNILFLINDRLMYLKPITVSCNHICRIVVPLSLRRVIFDAIHTSSTAGHMGEYKTLYRIKFRFSWPQMRSDIKAWERNTSSVY